MRYFPAQAKAKQLKENKGYSDENEITDLFLATAGPEAIMKISLMTYLRELEELTIHQIKEIILKNIRPQKRLLIVEI